MYLRSTRLLKAQFAFVKNCKNKKIERHPIITNLRPQKYHSKHYMSVPQASGTSLLCMHRTHRETLDTLPRYD